MKEMSSDELFVTVCECESVIERFICFFFGWSFYLNHFLFFSVSLVTVFFFHFGLFFSSSVLVAPRLLYTY